MQTRLNITLIRTLTVLLNVLKTADPNRMPDRQNCETSAATNFLWQERKENKYVENSILDRISYAETQLTKSDNFQVQFRT